MTRLAEISKRPFRDEQEKKHFETVTMQMGRVQLDSDWNEAFETLLRARARALRDVIGKYGSPNDGFLADTSLVLDHLESKEFWTFTGSADDWSVDYFEKLEKVEGKGSFRLDGNGKLSRAIPPLLKNFITLRQGLLDRGAQAGTPRLFLHCKVSATEDSVIILSLTKPGGAGTISVSKSFTVSCGDWQVLDWALDQAGLPADISSYTEVSIEITTEGSVYLDRLALDPGLIPDFSADFYVQGGDGTIGAVGRYYVDGLACIKEGFETYLTQKDYPEPAAVQGLAFPRLVYLDVWKRTITAVEDPDIQEVALGGPDTCAREQLVSQVKVVSDSSCAADIRAQLRPQKAGTLTAKLSPKAEQDRCDFRPELDYSGLNNSLYRIEIHTAGNANTATFKWSRNNGADIVPITSFSGSNAVIVPDDRLLCCGDNVELCDDISDLADFADTLKHGKMAVITAIDHDVAGGVKITLNQTTTPFSDASRLDGTGHPKRHPKLRKWHGNEFVKDYLNFDPDGTPSKELEHGIRLAFYPEYFYHGDYWQFIARVNTRSIEELDDAQPAGPVHHYAPLALVKNGAGAVSCKSCRNVFPPLTDLEASDIRFDAGCCDLMGSLGVENVQQAIEALCRYSEYDEIVIPGQSIQDAINSIGPEGGSIYLAPGIHIVTQTIFIKQQKNLSIRGDRSATRVVYIPEVPQEEPKDIQEAKAAIESKKEEIKNETDPEKEKALTKELQKLEIELEVKLSAYLSDLFRITGSETITFRDFLMLSFGADSLIAVLDTSKGITVSDCGIYNLPIQHKEEEEKSGKAFVGSPCIRAIDCCELNVEECRLVGNIGFLQQGAPDVSKTPLVDGMLCRNNRFQVGTVALAFLEGTRVTIQDNTALPLGEGMKDLCKKIIEEGLIDRITESDCDAEVEKTVNDIVEQIENAVVSCLSDIVPSGRGVSLLFAYILRMSRIERNSSWGDEAVLLFYSEENEIIANRISCSVTAVGLVYSFRTKLASNIFVSSAKDIAPGPSPKPEPKPAAPAAPANLKMDETSPTDTTDKKAGDVSEKADASLDFQKWIFLKEAYQVGGITPAIEQAVVIIQVADRLVIEDNDISGANGIAVAPIIHFGSILENIDAIWGVRSETAMVQAAVVEVKHFAELMGLQPTIKLIEAVLKLFSGGEDVDLIAILMGQSENITSPIMTVVVELLNGLFKMLLTMSLVSRSVISGNRFAVKRFGIRKMQEIAGTRKDDGLDITLTLGGVKIVENRFVGAEDTAVLWKSFALFANPELNGLLLTVGYEGLLQGLKVIRDFLQQLNNPQTGFTAAANPLNVFMATAALYAVGQRCTESPGTAATGTPTTQPVNPYADILQEIIDALDDLIEQLEDEGVRKNIADLSCSDDRISMNQIRGMGNGIHTNIANTIIESNRIDIEPGTSAIAEIFSIGRRFAAEAAMLNGVNEYQTELTGAVQGIDRPAVEFLGNALMNLNPHAVSLAEEMLADNPQEWQDLQGMLDAVLQFVPASSITKTINDKLNAMKATIPTANSDNIKAASDDLIEELRGHLTGYGIITEAPGVRVVANRIEALSAFGLGNDVRRASGGILLSGGERGIVDMIVYLLLLEEIIPLENFNIGGQGTLFRGNSVQWGTGHGISLSSYPLLFDVSIENNEIQNHGLAGILCDRPAFLSLIGGTATYSSQYYKMSPAKMKLGGIAQIDFVLELFMALFFVYKVRIVDNEINQCFLNEALGYAPGQPQYVIHFKDTGNFKATIFPAVILGGLMVRNAAELTCSRNTIRSCGAGEAAWPCCGSVLIDCYNIGYKGNKILENGRKAATQVYQPGCPRGGALFLGPAGHLNIANNEFGENQGITAVIVANYGVISRVIGSVGQVPVEKTVPGYDPFWTLSRALVSGNDFAIDDSYVWGWAKIHAGNTEDINTDNIASTKLLINMLNFSQNNILFPEDGIWSGVALAADRLLFNGNAVSGPATQHWVYLASHKGIGIGNILNREPEIVGDIKITDTANNEHNRW
jgi:hypothetical protein